MAVLRLLLRLLLYSLAAVLLVLAVGILWFVYYSRDLPDINALARFAPTTTAEVSGACLQGHTIAIPYASIGKNLTDALNAVEVDENDPGVVSQMWRSFTDHQNLHRAILSDQVSRMLFCTPSRMAKRQLDRLRTAVQLERHFSRHDLFTIYVNRVYVAEGEIGVQNASQRLFGKNPADLDISQSALLAGLIRSPSRFSPFTHPDRAIQRRNEVIDAMIAANMISSADGESAKSEPLGVLLSKPLT